MIITIMHNAAGNFGGAKFHSSYLLSLWPFEYAHNDLKSQFTYPCLQILFLACHLICFPDGAVFDENWFPFPLEVCQFLLESSMKG